MAVKGYEKLSEIFKRAIKGANGDLTVATALSQAYEQAAGGKGAERHGQNRPWLDQPILDIQRLTGWAFAIGQAMKKVQEASRMDPARAAHELRGAAVYLAGAFAFHEEVMADSQPWSPELAKRMAEKAHYQTMLEELAKIPTRADAESERAQLLLCLQLIGRLIGHEATQAPDVPGPQDRETTDLSR